MAEVKLNGLCYRFEDDLRLFELLDEHADEVYEEGRRAIAEINKAGTEEIHHMGQVFRFSDGFQLAALLDENANEVCEE